MNRAILLITCLLLLAAGSCIELQQAMGPGGDTADETLNYGPVVEQPDDSDGDEAQDDDASANQDDDPADTPVDEEEASDDPADAPEDDDSGTDDPADEPVDEEPVGAPPELAEGLVEVETGTGLKYIIIQEGSGPTVLEDDSISAHYDGYLEDGTVFDSSRDREPFTFQVGLGQVIAGWDEGFVGMKVGEQRRLIIPPDLAYGESGRSPTIPGNATLIFDVEVVEIN